MDMPCYLRNRAVLLTACLLLFITVLAPPLHAQTGLTRLGEFPVNTTTTGNQTTSAVAMNSSGAFVVVWQGQGSDGTLDIFAQRHAANGVRLGNEFRVNEGLTAGDQLYPSVAMNSAGKVVVVWEGLGGVGGGSNIFGRLYAADGTTVLRDFQANTGNGGNDAQIRPSVAMRDDGSFVVVWDSQNQDGSGFGIFAQRFDGSGLPLGTEFRATEIPDNDQQSGRVAMNGDGRFVVVWRWFNNVNAGANGYEVVARRFDFDQPNPALGPEFIPNAALTLLGDQGPGVVAMDASGGFVIAWTGPGDSSGDGVFFRRYGPDETALPSQGPDTLFSALGTRANSTFIDAQQSPQVAVFQGGEFVVAWQSAGQDGSGTGLYAQRFDVHGSRVGPEFPINQTSEGFQIFGTEGGRIACDGIGSFVTTWDSENPGGSEYEVYADKFFFPDPDLREFRVNSKTAGDQMVASVASAPDGRFVIVWESAGQNGARGIHGQRYDASARRFGDEFRVSSTSGEHSLPDVGINDAGDFVVAWQGPAPGDGDNTGILARRFSWDLSSSSSEFRVNTTTANKQMDANVAMDSDAQVGRFAIIWTDAAPGFGRPRIQFYNAGSTPTPRGSEIEVTSVPIANNPSITFLASHGYAIAWVGIGGGGDVFTRRFDRDGNPSGITNEADNSGDGNQYIPVLAFLPDGTFVIAWQNEGTDGNGDANGFGIFGRRLGADGLSTSDILRINGTENGNQFHPSLLVLPNNQFLVAYTSVGFDGSNDGVALQRLDLSLNRLEETRVNQFTTGNQTVAQLQRSISADAFGNYVIVWQSENQDGSGYGVYATKVFVSTPPVVTTGAATNPTATTATLNGTVTPNDVAVEVSFELAESEAGLDTAGVTTTAAVPANLAAGLTTAQAVSKVFPGLTLGIGDTPKTYYYRTKATPTGGGAPILGPTVSFIVQNTAPMAVDDAFVIIGDESLDPIKQFTAVETPGRDSDADTGDTLRIVSVTPPAGGSGNPQINTAKDRISYNPNDLFPDQPGGDSFTYTISDRAAGGLTATATVRVFSVKVLRGLYSGLIGGDGADADAVGRLDIMISPTGQVTGSFKWQGRPYSFKGATLGPDGQLTITKPKIGSDGRVVPGAQLEVTLTLDPVTRILTGTLTDTEPNPDLVVQAELTGTVTTDEVGTLPEAGTFNAVIDTGTAARPETADPEAGAVVRPLGVGFAQVTVKKSRNKRPARFVGRMPDDQPFSSGARALVQALRAAAGARYPVFVDNLYPKTLDQNNRLQSGGFVGGDVAFTKVTDRFDSGLNWERRPNVRTRFSGGFRTSGGLDDFTATLEAIRYGRPGPGGLPAQIPTFADPATLNARIEFDDGDLTSRLVRKLRLSRVGNGAVKTRLGAPEPINNANVVKLSVNAKSGIFSGSFIHPADAGLAKPKPIKFNGVFQKDDGQGTFTGPTNTGRIQILAR